LPSSIFVSQFPSSYLISLFYSLFAVLTAPLSIGIFDHGFPIITVALSFHSFSVVAVIPSSFCCALSLFICFGAHGFPFSCGAQYFIFFLRRSQLPSFSGV